MSENQFPERFFLQDISFDGESTTHLKATGLAATVLVTQPGKFYAVAFKFPIAEAAQDIDSIRVHMLKALEAVNVQLSVDDPKDLDRFDSLFLDFFTGMCDALTKVDGALFTALATVLKPAVEKAFVPELTMRLPIGSFTFNVKELLDKKELEPYFLVNLHQHKVPVGNSQLLLSKMTFGLPYSMQVTVEFRDQYYDLTSPENALFFAGLRVATTLHRIKQHEFSQNFKESSQLVSDTSAPVEEQKPTLKQV